MSIDLDRSRGECRLKRLTVEDGKTGAVIALTGSKNILDMKFKGSLNEETLNNIFEKPPGKLGWIRGDMRVNLRFDRPHESVAAGTLEGADLFLPFSLPIVIRHLNVQADKRVLLLNSGLFDLADMRINMKGSITASPRGFDLTLMPEPGALAWTLSAS